MNRSIRYWPLVISLFALVTTSKIYADNKADSLQSDEVAAVLANGEDEAYAEYLVGECVACHDPSGQSADGVPKIHGLDDHVLVAALLAYREGKRSNKIMGTVAASLGDTEISALAFYLAKR